MAAESPLRHYDFIEQREHSRMSHHVVNMDKRGCPVMWMQGLVGKFVCSLEVAGELVGRRDHRAQTATFHGAGRGWENTSASRILGEDATTPTPFVCDKGASPFDDLKLEWF